MSEAQRVGQLMMIDCPSTAVSSTTIAGLINNHVGSVILDGNSYLSVQQTAAITAQLQAHAPASVKLLISTDQEGGLVRRMRGPGFSSIPSAVDQGQVAPGTLQADATGWGGQLKAAGINVDLAPVLDTVPAGFGSNPPIGDLDREYGNTPSDVAAHGLAVAAGLRAGGVLATAKHFPGLGRVRGNTDTTSGVTDYVTTSTDPYLAPFGQAVAAGIPLLMMSTAIYARIDPGTPAAFSSMIVTGIVRQRLGYSGVIISDDLGAAAQVAATAVGQRAVDFIAAGGDLVLTVVAGQASTMAAALLARASADPAFRAKIDVAALRVLRLKQAAGLLG
jgi:beta-N-acetylhexosaminidase